jgi:hypothetical protein
LHNVAGGQILLVRIATENQVLSPHDAAEVNLAAASQV